MNQKKTGKETLIYILTIAFMVCIYIPFIIGLVSDDAKNHVYNGSAMTISNIFRDIAAVALVLLIIVLIASLKSLNHRPYLNVAKIIKFGMIPLYAYGMIILLFSLALVIVPVIGIMLTASAWVALPITGYILLLIGTIPQVMAIRKARNEGVIPKIVATLLTIASFIFVADVIALIIFMICSKAKNK